MTNQSHTTYCPRINQSVSQSVCTSLSVSLYLSGHELPVVHHDLADAPQGVALDIRVLAGDHLQGQVLTAQRVSDAASVGVVPRELAEVVQGDAYRILRHRRQRN